ncbi:MAG: NAD-dependent epimerase/dehydratase family protein [Gammaproteobacteria bacterium]|nr:NAD-dependent epimerase/dehydratase family protein [Gammaproteobacteria bacterium]
MTTLITGATGFVGSAVARKLLAAGHDVRALTRQSSDLQNLRDLAVEIVQGDLQDTSSLEKALQGCTTLLHVAADYRLWVPKPDEIYRNNVAGTRNIIEAAARVGVEKIVYTSSVATLGLHSDGSPADEDTPSSLEDMLGHYKRSKFLAEEAVRELVEKQGVHAVIVNPAAPVGPRDIKPTPTGRMILDAAAGKMPAYVDTGLDVVHVDDVAEGHLLALEKGRPGRRYILGSTNMTLREILTEVAGIAGVKPPKVRLHPNMILPIAYGAELWARISGKEPLVTVDGVKLSRKKMFFTSERARGELGYAPRPAREALVDAVAWFRANGYLS